MGRLLPQGGGARSGREGTDVGDPSPVERAPARPGCGILPAIVTTRRAASDPLRFDAAYFRRFYHGADRTHSAREMARLVSGVCGLSTWLGVTVRSALDVGAGTG